jgi:hypothetical protein
LEPVPSKQTEPAEPTPQQAGLSRRSLIGWGTLAGAGVVLAGAAPAMATSPGIPTPPKQAPQGVGLTPFPQQEDLNFQTLFAYGESAYGAGEVGEVASTVALVQADIEAAGKQAIPAYDSYVTRFEALANRIGDAADADLAAGKKVSARAKYLRSAMYYNCVLFFILGSKTPDRETEIYRYMQTKWAAAAALLEPVFERVEIAAKVRYPNPDGKGAPITRSITIPGYFAAAAGDGPKPTVIVNNGSDAQFIDVYAFGAAAALERGYNALIFEGPGQGSLLFEQNIPFTPYWQDVITPLVDYLIDRPEVDASNIALTGWSFGGVLVFRAAAFEHRLKAVVGDPGFVDNSIAYEHLTSALKDEFGGVTNAGFKKLFAELPVHGQTDSQLGLKFIINKRGEIYSSTYRDRAVNGDLNLDVAGLLDHVGSYNADAKLLSGVKAHVLINTYEQDIFFPRSASDDLKAGLTNAASVQQHTFTVAQGAEYHCAPMAPQLRNEIVYDWMDGIFSASDGDFTAAGKDDSSDALGFGIVGGAAVIVAGAIAAGESQRKKGMSGKHSRI